MYAATIMTAAFAGLALAAPSKNDSLFSRASCTVEIFEATDCSGSVLSRGQNGQCIPAGSDSTPGHAYKITGCPLSTAYLHEGGSCPENGGTIQSHTTEGCFAVNTGNAWSKIWVNPE